MWLIYIPYTSLIYKHHTYQHSITHISIERECQTQNQKLVGHSLKWALIPHFGPRRGHLGPLTHVRPLPTTWDTWRHYVGTLYVVRLSITLRIEHNWVNYFCEVWILFTKIICRNYPSSLSVEIIRRVLSVELKTIFLRSK